MPKILKVNTPGDFCSFVGAVCRHPLIGVVDYEKISPVPHSLNYYGVYGLFMHSNIPEGLTYGCGSYDYSSGTLICVAPGQLGGKEDNGGKIDLDGWALLFHPGLLKGTHLEKDIRKFPFFEYRVNEALHMSGQERDAVVGVLRSIQKEIDTEADAVQNNILIGYINVLLNYCQRFYNRQFCNRNMRNTDFLIRFNELLTNFFDDGRQLEMGIPPVSYFADKMNISPNYFSDVIKKTTGTSAGVLIREHVVRLAKNELASSGNVAGTAYALGFEYPQHFTRMFKRQTGLTPSQFIAGL